MTVINEMMMAMMVFLFLFRIFKPLWTLMFHFNFSSAIIRAATCKQEDPLQKIQINKNTPTFRRQYPKKKKKKKKRRSGLLLYQSIGFIIIISWTNWLWEHYCNLIVPCFNLISFVILPASIRFIGRKYIVYLTKFLDD